MSGTAVEPGPEDELLLAAAALRPEVLPAHVARHAPLQHRAPSECSRRREKRRQQQQQAVVTWHMKSNQLPMVQHGTSILPMCGVVSSAVQ